MDGLGPATIGLFRPRAGAVRDSVVALVAARDIGVEVDAGATAGTARADCVFEPLGKPPSTWSWPDDRAPSAPIQWGRIQNAAEALPVRMSERSRAVFHETAVTAQVDRHRLDLRQETVCHVRNGVLNSVDLEVPAQLEGHWVIEGDDVATRDRQATNADGWVRYRLTLAREVADSVRLRFHSRLPLKPSLSSQQPVRLEFPWLRVAGEAKAKGSARVSVQTDAAIRLRPDSAGWVPSTGDAANSSTDNGLHAPFTWTGTDGAPWPAMTATALSQAAMPALVVSRLLLVTVVAPDGSSRCEAHYRIAAHETELAFRLPTGSTLLGVRGGRSDVLEPVPPRGGSEYRVPLPDFDGSSTEIVIQYATPPGMSQATFHAPVLPRDAAVKSVFWLCQLPANQIVVGTPLGWISANDWSWQGFSLARRPRMNLTELSGWAQAEPVRAGERLAHDLGAPLPGSQDFLYWRPGAPASLQLPAYPRALVVGVSSGLVLGLGILFLVWRAARRLLWLAGLAAALALAASIDPDALYVGLQSSVLGIGLVIVAALTQRFAEKHRGAARFTSGSRSAGSGSRSASGLRPIAGPAGSDDSTVIRARTVSTIEHVPPATERAAVEGPD
jgi:hypothetical protein